MHSVGVKLIQGALALFSASVCPRCCFEAQSEPASPSGSLFFFILPDAFWKVPFGESVWILNTLKDAGTWRKDATCLGLQVRL